MARDDDRGSDRGRDRGGRDEGRGRDSGRDRGRDDGGSSRGRDDGGRSSGGRGGYEYKPRTREGLAKRASMGNNDFDKYMKDHIKTWKPADGQNDIRVLPPTWKDPEHWGYDLFVHFGVGADRQTYLDLKKMLDKPDPISEERDAALRAGEAEMAKELDSKRRVGIYLIDRDNEKEGVQFWAMPMGMDQDISKVSVDNKTGEVLPIDHPEDGYDVQFEKKGKGINTKYTGVAIARRSSPLGDDRWLQFAIDNPIPDQLIFYTYDEIAKEFGGAAEHRERNERDREEQKDGGSRGGNDRDRGGRGRDDDRSGRDSGRGSSRDDADRGDRSRDERGGTERGGRDDSRSTREDDRVGRGGREDSTRGGRASDSSGASLTWDSIHAMTGPELDDLCKEERELRNVEPNKATSDEELADWICEDLKIDKPAEGRGRARLNEPPPKDEDPRDRLREMRNSRER